MLRTLLILFVVVYATCAHADGEDRAERRELRERRDKVRAAVKKMQKCIENKDIAPCMTGDDDLETRAAVMKYFLRVQAQGD